MLIQTLKIDGIRNLHQLQLALDPKINILYGPNGSGKTSVLESISFLSLGRSFRTANADKLINFNKQWAVVSAVYSNFISQQLKISAIKHKSREKISKIGENVVPMSQIVSLAPTQVVHEGSSKLIFAEPDGRRKFLDWLVFYASEDYRSWWKDFNRVLQQRNFLLKNANYKNLYGFKEINTLFINLSHKIADIRAKIWQRFYNYWNECFNHLSLEVDFKPEIELFAGWKQDLSEELARRFNYDVQIGHTSVGPHRADLWFLIKNQAAKDVLSRGQGKVIVLSLMVARAKFLAELAASNDLSSVLIIDDLCAEIDYINGAKVINFLMQPEFNIQLFISGSKKNELEQVTAGLTGYWFEVNEGKVRGNNVPRGTMVGGT